MDLGISAYPSLSTDGRALAFASDRNGNWDIIVKATGTGTERVLANGVDRQMYASITRDGRRVSYGVVVVSEPTINRPIYVADVEGGSACSAKIATVGRATGFQTGSISSLSALRAETQSPCWTKQPERNATS